MKRQYYSGDTICLPTAVKYALNQNPELGVCVVFQNNKFNRWYDYQFADTEFSQRRLTSIVLNGQVSDFEEQFVIVDKNGNVCSTNCDAQVTVDENGIICINQNKYYVKPIEDKNAPQYVSGRSIKEINEKINNLIDSKTIKRPAGFGKSGYGTHSGQSVEPQIN